MEDNMAIIGQWSIPINFKGLLLLRGLWLNGRKFKDNMYRQKPSFIEIVCINAFIFAEPKHLRNSHV